ncbi:Small ubiquitin-related modifier [Lachnellula hyalina]|uniref:Small ubiquitin-related modifier n=1 Tax=Lachnellula hyalina TaxID=1316788 RepID=A0A8H8TZB6_9HELO|nr:Small ubiquitin-related modifier [Lachnellula hyalina]TVY26215.1 Small ubiquitin-related modifier [Lachnellula hyalina]
MSTNGSSAPESPTAAPVEEPKPKLQAIEVKVKDQHGNELTFKIKKTTPLEKVMNAYCTNKELSRDSLRFFYDGQRLNGKDTPESTFDLEDAADDEVYQIDVMMEQLGGY